MSLLADLMLSIFGGMVLPDFLTGNRPQTFQYNIQPAKFLLQPLIITNIIEEIEGEQKKSWLLGISHLDDGNLFLSWTMEELLLVHLRSEYDQKLRKHDSSKAPFSTRMQEVFCLRWTAFTRKATQLTTLLFLHSSAQHFPRKILQAQFQKKRFSPQQASMSTTITIE